MSSACPWLTDGVIIRNTYFCLRIKPSHTDNASTWRHSHFLRCVRVVSSDSRDRLTLSPLCYHTSKGGSVQLPSSHLVLCFPGNDPGFISLLLKTVVFLRNKTLCSTLLSWWGMAHPSDLKGIGQNQSDQQAVFPWRIFKIKTRRNLGRFKGKITVAVERIWKCLGCKTRQRRQKKK